MIRTENRISQELITLRSETGATVAQLAQVLGYSTRSGYQHLEERYKKETLPAEKSRKLAEFYYHTHNIPRDRLLALSDIEQPTTASDTLNRPYRVKGEVQAGVWHKSAEIPDADQITVMAPTGSHPLADKFYMVRARGDSMNRRFADGDFIVVLPLHADTHKVESGELLVIHHQNSSGLIEATVKELEINASGEHWLWPRSNNPLYQTPVKVPPVAQWGNRDSEICVVGVVMGILPSFERPATIKTA